MSASSSTVVFFKLGATKMPRPSSASRRASARRLQGAVLSPRITASVRRSMCYQYGSSRTRHKGSSSALEPPPHHRFREPEVLADLHPAKLPLVVIGVALR